MNHSDPAFLEGLNLTRVMSPISLRIVNVAERKPSLTGAEKSRIPPLNHLPWNLSPWAQKKGALPVAGSAFGSDPDLNEITALVVYGVSLILSP
jgi:hypothetical protein